MTEFGKLLRKIRIDCGELLYHMAKNLNVSPSFLSSVENGSKPVPIDWPERITALYGLDSDAEKKLTYAADETMKQIRIPVENIDEDKRALAMAFARRFDSLDKNEIETLMKSFTENKKKVRE